MIDITPDNLIIVQNILRTHLSPNATVWVFGSRARGTAKQFSDLDLAIDSQGKPLPTATIADLRDAFEESDLPYKVDIIDIHSITESFRNNIKAQQVFFPY